MERGNAHPTPDFGPDDWISTVDRLLHRNRSSMLLTNVLLIIIAALLAAMLALLYAQRPVTNAELVKLAQDKDSAGIAARTMAMPLVRVGHTVDVEVQNTVDVDVVNTAPLNVTID